MRKLLGLIGLMGLMGMWPVQSVVPIGPIPSAQAQTSDSADLSLRFDGALFFIDNEFFGLHVAGYTLPGFVLRPHVVWRLSHNAELKGGVHWLHFWGAHSYPAVASYGVLPDHSDTNTLMHVLPWLQAKLHATGWLTLTLGSLDPNDHQLPMPMYNPERLFVADPEQGVEASLHNKWLAMDVWVDWREFIWNRSPRQEKLTVGASGRLRAGGDGWEVYVPLHFVAQHVGGQVLEHMSNIQNNFNAAGGIGASYAFGDVMTADVSCRMMWYHQYGNRAVPFTEGWGLYPELRLYFPTHWRLMASYWTGHRFVPLMGSGLFSNISTMDADRVFDRNDVLTAKVSYELRSKKGNFCLLLDVSAYHFPLEGETEFTVGCSLPFYPTLKLR